MAGLFSPIAIKGMALANRIAMAPMASELADERGAVTREHIDHYVERAQAGVGLIIVEHSYVEPAGRWSARQMGIWHDDLVPGLKSLAAAIQAAGARVALQITHAGGCADRAVTGCDPLAPSAVVHARGKETPREMAAQDFDRVAAAFAAAARRCREAGFDAVEVHGAHGYFLSQCLSPFTNRRGDEYGCGLEGRARFPLRVVAAVRRAVGDDYPVIYRLGAEDEDPGGLTLDEACQVARWLVAAGVGALDVSGGLGGSRATVEEPGYFLCLAAPVKKAANVPVINAGRLDDPRLADRAIRDGRIDIAAIGRALLKDARWAIAAAAALGAGETGGSED